MKIPMETRTERSRYGRHSEPASSYQRYRLRLKTYHTRLELHLHPQLNLFPKKLRKSPPMTFNKTRGNLHDTYSGLWRTIS